ncbi:alpha-amylase family glycosyl hydrolase [Silanimonas sp.]|jgi:glycosidase|uniref:alpha-amylase family glycosyl hydrolase n=1 Tax=Silanimonas sp. TaxID=1929290 RepID=UPI0037C55CE2
MTPKTPRQIRVPAALLALALMGAAADAPAAPTPASQAVDWRDQVLYFAMIDRFADGDPANNDQNAGVFDPADGSKYSGGDLRGITQRLDYIEGLGVTGLWITPPVANQWWDEEARFSGYHGYWASDFSAVDAHYGTLGDYVALGQALDGRRMTLVQDIVVNHMGNFFAYDDWREGEPAHSWRRTRGSRPMDRPTQWPFSQNDPNDPAQRALSAYHWTPPVRDYTNKEQELTFQMAGLDDLDTESPVVRRALRKSFGDWITKVGVDGFRVDTAFYVPADFFPDFLHADDPEAPGVMRVAAAQGNPHFHLFGEGFGIDKPFEDVQMRKIDAYQRVEGGIPAMIQFPMYGTFGDVFARGHAPAELAWRIERTLAVHADPWRMPTFIDNHDVDRFLAGAGEPALKQALLAMLTLPGIPVLYYGTEQGFRNQRDAMFATGFGSGGRDHFDTAHPLYRQIAAMVNLRRAHPALSRARPEILAADGAGPGVVAWAMQGDAEAGSTDGDRLVVMLNTAEDRRLLDLGGLPPGARLVPLLALEGEGPVLQANADGRVLGELPARAGGVWRVEPAPRTADGAGTPADSASVPTLDAVPEVVRDTLVLTGTLPPGRDGTLVVDGDLRRAQRLVADAAGRWRETVPTDDFIDPKATHRVVVLAGDGLASPGQTFRVERDWALLAEATDPADDDAGPEGRYRYPSDPSYAGEASMDLRVMRVYGSGGALAIELAMGQVLDSWNPANGFDHVAFSVFLSLPGRTDGATAMPGQNATLPDGQRWQVRLRTHGWSNAAFTAEGADAERDGTPLVPGARIAVDKARSLVRFEFPAAALGHPADLSGLVVHATTWDWDGGWRAMTPAGGGHTMGGGDGTREPRWMDAMTLSVPGGDR